MTDIQRRVLAGAIAALMALTPVVALPVLAAGDAVDDAYTIDEDAALVADGSAAAGVLANDLPDPATLCVVSYDTSSLQGSFSAPADIGAGSFEYHPPANFHGTTTFTYAVATSSAETCPTVTEDTATVTITVNAVNDAPTASNDSFSALADRTLNAAAPGVLGNDADVDGDSLTAVLVTAPAHGTLTLAANGGFSYTPNPGYTGSDAFSYRASDGTAQSQIRVVSLTVTAIPTPSPTPIPTPTAVAPSASPEASPSESPLPSDSGLASPSPTTSAGPTSSAGPIAGPVSEGTGPPILAILALVVLIGLLAVAGVFFVRSQRAGFEEGYETGAYEGLADDDLDAAELADDEPEDSSPRT